MRYQRSLAIKRCVDRAHRLMRIVGESTPMWADKFGIAILAILRCITKGRGINVRSNESGRQFFPRLESSGAGSRLGPAC